MLNDATYTKNMVKRKMIGMLLSMNPHRISEILQAQTFGNRKIYCICNFHLLAVRLFVRWRSHSGRGPLFARLLLSHGCVGSLAILGKQCACALGLTFGFDRGLAFFSFDINPLNTEPNAHCHSPAAYIYIYIYYIIIVTIYLELSG